MLVNACFVPVQCRVVSSVSRSAHDQTLKYGSHAIRGTAGGRRAIGFRSSAARLAVRIVSDTRQVIGFILPSILDLFDNPFTIEATAECGFRKIAFWTDSDLQLDGEQRRSFAFFKEALENRMENFHDTPDRDNRNLDTFSPLDSTKSPANDSWVRRHGPLLVILVAAFAYFMTQFNALSVIMVVLGISILVFLHEVGHFLVAK